MLPLTLVVIASIGLVIAAVNEWVMQSVRDAQVISDQTETELAMTETREEFVYYMLMRPISIRGLELGRPTSKIDPNNVMALMASDFQSDKSLQFDGTPYQVQSHPDFYLRIYDGRGLVNLNGFSQPQVRRLLMQFQLSEQQRNSLADTLEDYIDRDDLTRISGAEAQDYKRVNRPPPSNALLVTPMEAQSVLGWDQLKDLWHQDMEEPVLTTCGEQGFNPNTATRLTLLANLPGVLEEDIAKIKERRAQKAFRNVREVGVVAGVALRDEPFLYTFIPGNCVIAELEHKPSGLRRRISLTIRNFNGNINPWYVDYALSLPPRNQDDSGSLEAAAGAAAGKGVFPTPVAVDPDQPADGPGGFAQPPNSLDPQP
ncbi:MAG: general secretion pathway protein GspK [Rhodospirillaceae bacterium]|nr:general secretion pathway protein GspK [Rhodospirillaceae bacterium]